MNNWKRLEGFFFPVEIIASKDKQLTQKFKISYYLLPLALRTILNAGWNFFSQTFLRNRIKRRFGLRVCVEGMQTYSSTISEGLKCEPEPLLFQPMCAPHPEPNWDWLESRRAKQPGSPHIITGLREAIKPGLWRLPPCTNLPGLQVWSRLSALMYQRDRWFGLGTLREPHPGFH